MGRGEKGEREEETEKKRYIFIESDRVREIREWAQGEKGG